ncbi:hypothetical protein GS429_08375 [Natronorubrum sp. JWXQ-INN-674]|uniref:Uncharacterized protein n=1 Tax=Natronorubrum halalkaliphilum TaxID=2691917 RepID=A0A6B0VLQ8_9EURY|nr:hypothetical protein [Natronorubrum halalkaliphilum]MXV62075.1 hypothetical protein [Natronorubrum halalkaliphilum]
MSDDTDVDDSDYRTSVEHVRMQLEPQEYPIEELSDEQVEIIGLQPAHLDVDELLADTGMSEQRLEIIERLLAGHHLLNTPIEEVRQTMGETHSDGSSTTFAGPNRSAEYYRSTQLGKEAIAKDTSNTLQNVGKNPPLMRTPDARGSSR